MTEEVNMALEEAKEQMANAVDHLKAELLKIRAGKANPSMLDSVKVDYYGTMTPLSQVSNIATPDARTLQIQPWEKAMLDPIATGIINSNLGLNPQSNGDVIMINVPAPTSERRKELAKIAKAAVEHAKVSIRTARKDANDFIKSAEKDGLSEDLAKNAESEVQDITNDFVRKIDDILAQKEKDIMTI